MSLSLSKEAFNPACIPSAVPSAMPSAIQIPWALYAAHGGPRKPQLRSSRGPHRGSLPRKSTRCHAGHEAFLYNPTDLSLPLRTPFSHLASALTSQSNPTAFLGSSIALIHLGPGIRCLGPLSKPHPPETTVEVYSLKYVSVSKVPERDTKSH